jgi:hypothetical protein
MNRIYQGRVSKVETLNGKNAEPQPLVGWLDKLWQHHELFQDAVNYYLLALLALANDHTSGLGEIKRRVSSEKEEDEEYHIWLRVKKHGQQWRGMRESVRKYLLPHESDPTFTKSCETLLDGCAFESDGKDSTTSVLELALLAILSKCTGESGIRDHGGWMFSRACDPDYTGSFPYEESVLKRDGFADQLRTTFHAITTEVELEKFANTMHLGWVVNLKKGAQNQTGQTARDRLLKATAHFLEAFGHEGPGNQMDERVKNWLTADKSQEETLLALTKRIAQRPDEKLPQIPVTTRGVSDRVEACLLFQHFPSEFTANLLRLGFPKPQERQSTRPNKKTKLTPEEQVNFTKFGNDPIYLARGKRGYIFKSFTSLLNWEESKQVKSFRKEFDVLAFKEALKAFNQMKKKTDERRDEQKKKRAQIAAMRDPEGHKSWKGDGERELDRPSLLAGDTRVAALEKLLASEDFRRKYEMTAGETVEYGLRERTIRSFRDLREQWRKEAQDAVFSPELQGRLRDKLREFQKENPRIVGSVELFEALLEKDLWTVWRDEPSDPRFAKDPLKALVAERELKEEISNLDRPVRFTPADPVHSRRQYYFPGFDEATKCKQLGHDAGQLSCRVELAVSENGKWKCQLARMHYEAPRFLRDGLRGGDGEKLGEVSWLQPMMEALGMNPGTPQSFDGCPVALMPEERELPGNVRDRRILLNFPITLETLEVQRVLRQDDKRALFAARKKGKEIIAENYWERQCAGADGEFLYLRWPKVAKEPENSGWWWNRVSQFRCLSVDLGQRDAGAFAILDARPGKPVRPVFRYIGNDGKKDWHSTVEDVGMFRLPGEDVKMYREKSSRDTDNETGRALREELHGERGRSATKEEWAEACEMVERLGLKPSEILGDDCHRHSFPELNSRLLRAFAIAQGRLAKLQSWSWRVKDKDARENARIEITESKENLPELTNYAANSVWPQLIEETKKQCEALRTKLSTEAQLLANRIVPLRDRLWEWAKRKDNTGCHVLCETEPNKNVPKQRIRGQRGLSLERLEQLDELRRRLLALNRALLHTPGERSKHGKGTKGRELPDPCPDLLRKMDQLREQRVKQTAHLILARALGVTLRSPEKSPDVRAARDIHGEYTRIIRKDKSVCPPVDFIVLENLDRYTASQGRARNENSRLMKWCHRELLLRLKEMATEVYGIPIIEVHAAYSSRFCSRSGIAGFRAVELTPDAEHEWQWRKHLERLAKHDSGEKKLKPPALREVKRVAALLETLKRINSNRRRDPATNRWVDAPRTLLAPMAGGPIFVPMAGAAMQADINAAINIGLRAIASPDCHNILHRIRSIANEGQFQIRAESKREKARWPGNTLTVEFRQSKSAEELAKGRNPNFFVDAGGVAKFDRARIADEGVSFSSTLAWPLASGRGLWGTVNRFEWLRVNQLNNERLGKKWGETKLLEASPKSLAWPNAITSK